MNSEPAVERRRNPSRSFRFNLLSLFLIVACAAAWMSYWVQRNVYRQLKSDVSGMKAVVGELDVKDPTQFAIQELPKEFSDRPKWQVWVPEGEFELCVATSFKGKGIPDTLLRSPVSPGMRHVSMSASPVGNGADWKVFVAMDGQDLPVELTFPRDRDDYNVPNEVGVGAHELFRGSNKNSTVTAGRFDVVRTRLPVKSLKPDAANKYLMVWIEPKDGE